MKDSYNADHLLEMSEEHWPATCTSTHRFAVYVNRVRLLGLHKAQALMREKGLSLGEFDVLSTLRRSPPPYRLSPTELQRSTLITSGGLTKLLYQLESKGLIERSVLETDKRSKLVHLSRKGRSLIEAAMKAVTRFQEKWLGAALDDDELEQLNTLLGKVLRVLEAN
jgi:DNA-binding MarR family transcriptional regulator